MMHFTCDCCKRPIDPANAMRYVVRLEVYAALDPTEDEQDDDRDHLQEIQDILERIDDADDSLAGEDVYHQTRFDLCEDCRRKFVQNPLGRATPQVLNFSEN